MPISHVWNSPRDHGWSFSGLEGKRLPTGEGIAALDSPSGPRDVLSPLSARVQDGFGDPGF